MAVGGCALQRGLPSDARATLKGRPLTTLVRRAPPLAGVLRINYAAVGALAGAIATSDAGERFVRENAIADPALEIARELGDGLGRGYGVRPSPPVLAVVADEPTTVAQANPAADLVLDVWTASWSIEPFSSENTRYKVRYVVNMRLIDAKVPHPIDGKSGAVIAEGTCTCESEDASLAPAYEELVADHARRVKSELDTAVEFCVEDLRSRILSATPQP